MRTRLPDSCRGVGHDAWHQMSVLGKSFHISRRNSAMSSSEMSTLKSAHNPSGSWSGPEGVAVSDSANFNTCLRFSAGSCRTVFAIASSTLIEWPLLFSRRAGAPATIGLSVGDDRSHSKNRSRGNPPHISLRASAISSSEIEGNWPAQIPYMDLRGRVAVTANRTAKSSTSCFFSGGRSRSAASSASSIGSWAMSSYYRAWSLQ